MSEPQGKIRTTGIAIAGQPLLHDEIHDQSNLPKSADVSVSSQFAAFVPPLLFGDTGQELDGAYILSPEAVLKVTREFDLLRQKMHFIRIEILNAERKQVEAKYKYEGARKRKLITMTGASSTEREAAADLLTEELYATYLVTTQVVKELTEQSKTIRLELNALTEISHNMKKLLEI